MRFKKKTAQPQLCCLLHCCNLWYNNLNRKAVECLWFYDIIVVSKGGREMQKTRDFGWDNLKALLIFLVVVGHLLEICKVSGGEVLYRLIYFFHMPAFLFLSGYFARKKPRLSGVLEQLLTYLAFQTLYLLFAKYVLQAEQSLQFHQPYWILWFALVRLYYTVLTPLYLKGNRALVLALSFLLAFGIGFISQVSYQFSLSRFFVFQPFFILGLFYRDAKPKIDAFFAKSNRCKWILCIATLLTIPLAFWQKITNRMLYGSYPYADVNGLFFRVLLAVVALLWISFFCVVLFPKVNRKIKCVSTIGANSLPVFLLHGFVMKLLAQYGGAWQNSYLAIISMSVLCLLAFGNHFCTGLVRFRKIKEPR